MLKLLTRLGPVIERRRVRPAAARLPHQNQGTPVGLLLAITQTNGTPVGILLAITQQE